MAIIYGKVLFIEKKRLLLGGMLFLWLFFALSPRAWSTIRVRVLEVLDGDTVRILTASGKCEILRYAGIDTPELHHPEHPPEEFGLAARERNRELAEGKVLEFSPASPKRDRYGRLLGYLRAELSGDISVTLQEILLSEGLGVPRYGNPGTAAYARFEKAFREARRFSRGLWRSGAKRIYTPSQIWDFLPYLRGHFLLLRCVPGEWKRGPTQIRIATEDPRIHLCISSREVPEEFPKMLEKCSGKICSFLGKVSVSYGGVLFFLHSPEQLW